MIQEYEVPKVDLPCTIRGIEDLHEDRTFLKEDHRRSPPLDGYPQQKPWEMKVVVDDGL
jgi:hypothetical protein